MEQLAGQMRTLIYTMICFQCLLQITQGSSYQKYLKFISYLLTVCICCQIILTFSGRIKEEWFSADVISQQWSNAWNGDALQQEQIEQYSRKLEEQIKDQVQQEYIRKEGENGQYLEESQTVSGGVETGR